MIGSLQPKMAPAVAGMLVGLGTQAGQGILSGIFGNSGSGPSALWTQQFPAPFVATLDPSLVAMVNNESLAGQGANTTHRAAVLQAYQVWQAQQGSGGPQSLVGMTEADLEAEAQAEADKEKMGKVVGHVLTWGGLLLGLVLLVKLFMWLFKPKGTRRPYRRRRMSYRRPRWSYRRSRRR